MINTLRITSAIAVVLAGVFFVFPVLYGVRSDEHVKGFLDTPGIREKFEGAADSRAKNSADRVSPLVQQAEAFASYLNPKPMAKTTSPSKRPNFAVPSSVTPKFKLRCTSYCQSDPNMSLALIDEPGKGRHWVRPSSKVGHLLVEQIKDGFVVIKGGDDETFEIKIEQTPSTGSRETGPIASGRAGGLTGSRPILPASGRSPSGAAGARSAAAQENESNEREARAKALIEKLRGLQKSAVSDEGDSGPSDREKAARIERLISQYQSTRVSPEEARKLGNLGRTLKDAEADPNGAAPQTADDTAEPAPDKPAEPTQEE